MVRLLRRLHVHGVFWRELLAAGVRNCAPWSEPWMMWWWSALFLIAWRGGRRGLLANYRVIFPRASYLANLWRAYRAFVNFAWTFGETMRFLETRADVDWEIDGLEHFREIEKAKGGIILTAHMGNYDLGAYFFSERVGTPLHIVRAPEPDADTEEHASSRRDFENLRVSYNVAGDSLALDLLGELREGRLVAIQGDRIQGPVSRIDATIFGSTAEVPAGPFALAMIARVPIFPLFVVRAGYRRYRVIVREKIEVTMTGRDREGALRRAAESWGTTFESVIQSHPTQWFGFVKLWKSV